MIVTNKIEAINHAVAFRYIRSTVLCLLLTRLDARLPETCVSRWMLRQEHLQLTGVFILCHLVHTLYYTYRILKMDPENDTNFIVRSNPVNHNIYK